MTARYPNIPILTDVAEERADAERGGNVAREAPVETSIALEEILPFEIGDETAREARIELARDAADALARGAREDPEVEAGKAAAWAFVDVEPAAGGAGAKALPAEHASGTDAVAAARAYGADEMPAAAEDARPERDVETLVAELQTRLASSMFALMDELMRSAFSEMEAKLHQQMSARLRSELPELIDSLLREHLGADREP